MNSVNEDEKVGVKKMKYLESLKEDLAEMSNNQMMITVKRSDLQSLIRAYEKLKEEKSSTK